MNCRSGVFSFYKMKTKRGIIMGKFRFLCVALPSIAISLLAGCSGPGSYTPPQTKQAKVSLAFNGVEQSFKNQRGGTSKGLLPKDRITEEEAVRTIRGFLSVERETDRPDFPYDEPPMIQFQYLKALYEEVGDGFSFGTRYTYNIKGELYYDFASHEEKREAAYLNAYSLDLSIALDIDENDLITANVGFDITYRHGTDTRHQVRYADLYLDYDMNEASPTYTLKMRDYDSVLDFPNVEERYVSAEYDYVQVNQGAIVEWRKFGVCAPTSLELYNQEDYVHKYSVLRAYKENKLSRITNVFNQDPGLFKATVEGLGLDELPTRFEAFKRLAPTENSRIKTVYDRFCQIYQKDIINALVYTGATEQWDDEPVDPKNLFLRIIPAQEAGADTVYGATNLIDIFNPNSGWEDPKGGQRNYYSIYLKNGEQEDVAVYNDFSAVNVSIRSTSHSKTEWVSLEDDTIVDSFENLAVESGFVGKVYEGIIEPKMSFELSLSLKTNPSVKLQSPFFLDVVDEEACRRLMSRWTVATDYINAFAPIKNAIPAFPDVDGLLFAPYIDETDGMSGHITFAYEGSLDDAVARYTNQLMESGFVENRSAETYTGRVNDDYVLVLKVSAQAIRFEFKKEAKPTQTISEALEELLDCGDVMIPVFEGDYEFSVEGNVIRISLNDPALLDEYVASFAGFGFMTYKTLGHAAATLYKDEVLYRVRSMGKSLTVEKASGVYSLTGDMNGWSLNAPEFDFRDLNASNNELTLQMMVSLSQGEAFKVVENHAWGSRGGYGYGMLEADPSICTGGENENIVMQNSGNFLVRLIIDMDVSSDTPNINLVRIVVTKE